MIEPDQTYTGNHSTLEEGANGLDVAYNISQSPRGTNMI